MILCDKEFHHVISRSFTYALSTLCGDYKGRICLFPFLPALIYFHFLKAMLGTVYKYSECAAILPADHSLGAPGHMTHSYNLSSKT